MINKQSIAACDAINSLLRVLHPSVICLIGDYHGKDRYEEACNAINQAKVLAEEIATDLIDGAPLPAKEPRVLVVVSGGIADPICDDGVDVEVFDWDNYNAEEDDAKTGVPAHFADLAESINVPVK